MYENMTYENILNSMLGRVPSTIDTREGSIIYNALAPAAYELAQAYFFLENFSKLLFIDTSEGEFLTKICAQFGVNRKAATAAIKVGFFKNSFDIDLDVPIGSRFGINGIVYSATKKIAVGIFEITCESLGSIGNSPQGDLLPIDNIAGLSTAILSNTSITIGADEELDEDLRQRTLTKIQNPSTSGSINDYKQWSLSIQGVGGVKVFPLWNGNGTVKLILIGTNKEAADSTIINSVTDYIETVRPIGATVTVEAASDLLINISVSLTLADGYTNQEVLENITATISQYIKSIAFIQESVSYAKVGNAILDALGVIDYANLTVNGGVSNIPISSTAANCQTPVIGTVTVI